MHNKSQCFLTFIIAVLYAGLLNVSYGEQDSSWPEALVSPTSSPLTKIQLVQMNSEKPVFMVPQTTGFIIEGGYFVTISHMFETNLIRKLQKGNTMVAYMKFPLFQKDFFGLDVDLYPKDILYFDESATAFRNHTYFVKLTPVRQNFEQDYTIWTFNKEISKRLPSLKFSTVTNLSPDKPYYMLQSANPENSTGYLLNKLSLNGVMFQHLPQNIRVRYAPCNNVKVVFNEKTGMQAQRPLSDVDLTVDAIMPLCFLGKRYLFDGYFKFGSSGAPILNDKYEVVSIQSEALYTQYKYNEIIDNGKRAIENQGFIFTRCASVPCDSIIKDIEQLENSKK